MSLRNILDAMILLPLAVVHHSDGWVLGGASFALAIIVGWLTGRSMARHAVGPAEQRYIARACLMLWSLIGLFLVSAFALPSPYRFVIPSVLFFAIPLLMYRWSNRRQLLRARELHQTRLKR